MSAIEQIIVGDKTYKVQELSVLDTIYFHAEAMRYFGDTVSQFLDIYMKMQKDKEIDMAKVGEALKHIDPEAIRTIQPKILRQVATPENRFLDNEMAIEEWFARPENSGDVWEVTIKAGSVLLGKCLPRFLKEVMGTMKATAESLSRTNIEQKP